MAQKGLKPDQLKEVASAPELYKKLQELSDGVVSPQSAPSAVASYSAGVDLVGVDGTGSNAAPLAGTETRLDGLDSKVAELVTAVNALRTALIAAGVLQ